MLAHMWKTVVCTESAKKSSNNQHEQVELKALQYDDGFFLEVHFTK